MKGQMFIVTVVFLVGLIFVVQQLIFQYSYLDLPAESRESDFHLLMNLQDYINSTISSTHDCSQAGENLEKMQKLLFGGDTGGRAVSLVYSINCDAPGDYWDNSPPEPAPVNLTLKISGEDREIIWSASLYSTGF